MNLKEKYGYNHNDMKKVLLKMGGEVSRNNEDIINIFRDQGSLPEKKGGNVWVFKGHTYDFICIRYKALKHYDIKRLLELLNIESLPAKNPLRRILVRMMIRDNIEVSEFYKIIRNNLSKPKTQEPKRQLPKGMPSWIATKKRNGFSIELKSQFIFDEAKKLEKEAKRKGQRGLFVGYGRRLYLMNDFQGDRSQILSKIIEIYQENEERRKISEIAQKMKMKMIEEVNKLSSEERTEERVNEIVSPFMEYKLPRIKIVGINYTKYSAQVGEVITLIHEKDNPHDSKAIGVYNEEGNRFGYVARTQSLSSGNKKNGCIGNEEALELLPHATKVIVEEMHNGFGYAKIQI